MKFKSMRFPNGFLQLSKKEKGLWVFFTLIFSTVITAGFQITFTGSTHGRPDENYLNPPGPETLFIFLCTLAITNLTAAILYYFNLFCQKKRGQAYTAPVYTQGELKKVFFISFAVFFIAWLPYFLACLPGGVYVDTFSSIYQAYSIDELGMRGINNRNPILYTLLWRLFIVAGRKLGLDAYQIIVVFSAVQYLLMAGIMAWLIVWLRRHGLRSRSLYFISVFVALFPLFPLYAVSLWKDTQFNLFLLLFILNVSDYVLEKSGDLLCSGAYLIKSAVLGILVCFFRNNGKYIVFLTFLVVILMNLKKLLKLKKFLLMALSAVLIVQTIQGPLYDRMNYNLELSVESLGIPMQQIAYLVYYDYDLTDAEKEYIETICPIASIKENYNPCIFDSLKWDTPEFDNTVLEDDLGAFLKVYLKLLLRYPAACLKAYLLATAGFWAVNVASSDGYAQTYVWFNTLEVEGHDFFQENFGIPVQQYIWMLKPVSSAAFLYILFYTAFILLLNREYRKLLILLPGLACWLTVMIATPIACSLRYVYILVLMIPLDLYLICTSKKREKKNSKNKNIPEIQTENA